MFKSIAQFAMSTIARLTSAFNRAMQALIRALIRYIANATKQAIVNELECAALNASPIAIPLTRLTGYSLILFTLFFPALFFITIPLALVFFIVCGYMVKLQIKYSSVTYVIVSR